VLAALLAAAIVVAAMWPHTSARDRVNAYITQVNAVGKTFSGRYKTVDAAFRSFSFAPAAAAKELPHVQASARELTRLRRQLAAVPAPSQAQPLRARLIAFYRQQEAVAWELVAVASYLPQLSAAEQSLAPAGVRMRAKLKRQTDGHGQATVLRAYAATVERTASTLGALHAPPLFAQAQAAQVARLRASAASIRNLAAALAENKRAAVQAALNRVARQPPASTAAARTAIAAYNHRVLRIRALSRAAELERRRLADTLT
jgi:hypothetical protein